MSEAAGCCSTSVHEADRGLGSAPFGEVEAIDIDDSIDCGDIDDACIDRDDNGLDDGPVVSIVVEANDRETISSVSTRQDNQRTGFELTSNMRDKISYLIS